MITTELQYHITKEQAEKFEQALACADQENAGLHPRLQQAIREGMESILDDLRGELAEYEARQRSKATA